MQTTPKSKWLGNSAEWLLDTGLLGEINRLVLHPRGMALSVLQSGTA